ncbi:hypothetical protein [Desulfofundulus thermosubterraneus]|uniref:Uncharacterized protein n=1 Tax=Desulfofundulus thermosubterraneus DSM 16057 TaxID=1121432 RepID=A0A1M6CV12_9FIRM|nr:hypothetical protein [Desulfofundulus thermosubterraneus]SHI64800.1 hypothetical protein SAMN02745219_00767 [Desulfofundulus thermosubterraneus DSM 16057]
MSEAQLQSYYGAMDMALPLVDRLRQLQGQQVTIYVMHLMRHQVGTFEVTGMLHAVGIDYVELHVAGTSGPIRYVFIPIAAIGAVIAGGPLAFAPGPGVYPPHGGL